MLAETREGKLLINEVAYRIIQDNAPQELPRYVPIRDEYFASPEQFSQPKVSQDEALGIGVTAALQIFTRAVFLIAPPVLSFILNKVVDILTEKGTEKAVEKGMEFVSSLFNQPEPQSEAIFTSEQLNVINQAIQDIANTEAQQCGVPPEQARIVGNAIIAKLALTQ